MEKSANILLVLFLLTGVFAQNPTIEPSNALITKSEAELIFLNKIDEISKNIIDVQILETKLLAKSSNQYYYRINAKASQIVQCIKAPCNPIEITIQSIIDANTGEVTSIKTGMNENFDSWEAINLESQETEIKSWNSLKFDFSGEKGVKTVILLDSSGKVSSSSSTNGENLLMQVSEGEYTAIIAIEGREIYKTEIKVVEKPELKDLQNNAGVQIITASNKAPTLVSLVEKKEAHISSKDDFESISKTISAISKLKLIEQKIKEKNKQIISVESLSVSQIPGQKTYRLTAISDFKLFGIIPWGVEKKEIIADEDGNIVG